jgi:two-component system, NarL family, sensor kinase
VTTTTPHSIRLRRGLVGRLGFLRGTRSPDPGLARLLVRFALSGLVAVIVIGALGFVAIRKSAAASAIRQAKELTELAGRGIAQPLITPGVLRGDPAELARLDRAVRQRILTGHSIVRVKVWDASGRIVYSDARQLIGSVFRLPPDELRTLQRGGTDADASDLNRPENRTERSFSRLVEVYVGIVGPGGQRLLYEDYERSSAISASSRRQWMGLLPALLGALLIVYLVQVPLAYSLAQRLRARQREREELLRRAIDASDLERRRIAADLHDSTVQRLAGVSLSLAAAAARRKREAQDDRTGQEFALAASQTRETIRELRTLLVDIYPPTLQRSGLRAALDDLVAPLKAARVAVTLEVSESLEVPDDTEALLYRVAQEALRNARTHGEATAVEIHVEGRPHEAVLIVADNGRGFSPGDADEARQASHFGLRLMRDLADHAGGRLEVQSSPGNGTVVRLEVPLP